MNNKRGFVIRIKVYIICVWVYPIAQCTYSRTNWNTAPLYPHWYIIAEN